MGPLTHQACREFPFLQERYEDAWPIEACLRTRLISSVSSLRRRSRGAARMRRPAPKRATAGTPAKGVHLPAPDEDDELEVGCLDHRQSAVLTRSDVLRTSSIVPSRPARHRRGACLQDHGDDLTVESDVRARRTLCSRSPWRRHMILYTQRSPTPKKARLQRRLPQVSWTPQHPQVLHQFILGSLTRTDACRGCQTL
jgi:hypothetical protein